MPRTLRWSKGGQGLVLGLMIDVLPGVGPKQVESHLIQNKEFGLLKTGVQGCGTTPPLS